MLSSVTERPGKDTARQNHRAVVRVRKLSKLCEVFYCDGRTSIDATIGWTGEGKQSVSVVRHVYGFIVIAGKATAHSVLETFTTAVKQSDHPGTRDCAESSKKLLQREPVLPRVNIVQYNEGVIIHNSMARIVYEDEGYLP